MENSNRSIRCFRGYNSDMENTQGGSRGRSNMRGRGGRGGRGNRNDSRYNPGYYERDRWRWLARVLELR